MCVCVYVCVCVWTDTPCVSLTTRKSVRNWFMDIKIMYT